MGGNVSDQGLHLREGTIKLNVYDDNSHSGVYNMTSNGTDWQVTFDASYLNTNFYVSFMSDAYFDGNNNAQWGNVETDSFAVEKGYDYTFAGKYNVAVGSSEDIINNCKYDVPLYFGCFYRGNSANAYNNYNKPDYNSFYWQANISQRPDVSASIKGLVDNELHNNKLTQNNIALPYFDSAWVSEDNSRTDLMESYENIWFPYYKMRTTANDLRGSTSSTRGYAEFYQFNSKDTSLYFDGTNYTESNTPIHSQGTNTSPNGTVGFYPFNNTDNNAQLNLGFGARFDVSFRLSRDGKVETVDSNGKPTGDKINAMFEFIGDDDVWIYIDNKLVLDLGGCHKDATGLIDFADKKVYTNDLFEFDANEDTLNRTTASSEANLTDIFEGADMFIGNDYNEVKVHTLTLFYMERGMYESDLLMRFNFAVIPNENILRVVNLSKDNDSAFSDAIDQLLANSLFVYELENTGTHALNITDSEILYPTYDKYKHNVTELQSGTPIDDTGGVYLNTSYDLDGNGKTWDSDGAVIGAYLWGGSQSAKTVLAEQIEEHLYRINTEDYTNIHFMRISSDCSENFPYNGYLNSGNSGYWNRYKLGGFTTGATYSINGWNSGALSTTTLRKIYPAQSYNFNPSDNKVANVSYKWIDSDGELTENIPDGRNGLTGKTDSNGRFGMYAGSSNKESSVEFVGQFEKGSTIRFMQTNFVNANTTYESTDLSDSSKKVTDIFERIGLTVRDNRGRIVSTQSITSGKDKGISFTFDNVVSVPEESVALTIYITNELDVSNLTFTKSTPGYTGDADCTFQIHLRNLFGTSSYDDFIDYSKLKATGNVSGTITVNSMGQFTTKANETVTFLNIPALCEYKITEIDCTNDNLNMIYTDCDAWKSVNSDAIINNEYSKWDATIEKFIDGVTAVNFFNIDIVIESTDYDLTNLSVPGTVSNRTAHRILTSTIVRPSNPIHIYDLPPDAIVTATEEDLTSNPDFISADSTTSVMLNRTNSTGTLINTYDHINTHDLTITKSISGDYTDFNINNMTPFYVEIELVNNDSNIDLHNISISCADYQYTYTTANRVEISASVSENNPIYIYDIPEGTSYNVTETYASRTNTDSMYSQYEGYGFLQNNTTVYLNNHYTTTQNHNLTINKILEGEPSDHNVDNDTQFEIYIQLNDPTGDTDFNNLNIDALSYYTYPAYSSCEIYAHVSVNHPIVIGGLGDSLTYNIQERSANDINTTLSTYIASGFMNSNDATENITNYYDAANKLKINKLISGYYNDYGITNYTNFKMQIQLSNPGGNDGFSYITIDPNITCDRYSVTYSTVDIIADLSVAQNIILKNLPDSYNYTIAEINFEPTGARPYIKRNGSYVSSSVYQGAYNGNNLELTFKNDFPAIVNRTAQFYIHKNINGAYADYNIDNNTVFDLIIDLTYNGPLNNANIFSQVDCNQAGYTIEDISENNKQKIRIRTGISSDGSDLRIRGVPFDTVVHIEEQNIDPFIMADDSVTVIDKTIYNSMTSNDPLTLNNKYLIPNIIRVNKVLHDDDNILDDLVRTQYRTELYNRNKTKNDLVFPLLVVITTTNSELNVENLSMNHSAWQSYTSTHNNDNNAFPISIMEDTNNDGILILSYFTWYSVNEPLLIQGLPDNVKIEVTELFGDLNNIHNLSQAMTNSDDPIIGSYTQTDINRALKPQLILKYNPYISDASVSVDIKNDYDGTLYMHNYFQNDITAQETFGMTINKTLTGSYETNDIDDDTLFDVFITLWSDKSFNYDDIVTINAVNYSISSSDNNYIDFTAKISKNDNIQISGLSGNIEYIIVENTNGLNLNPTSVTELSGTVSSNATLQLINDFAAFSPYILPAAGLDDQRLLIILSSVSMLGFGTAYVYFSYKRRKN